MRNGNTLLAAVVVIAVTIFAVTYFTDYHHQIHKAVGNILRQTEDRDYHHQIHKAVDNIPREPEERAKEEFRHEVKEAHPSPDDWSLPDDAPDMVFLRKFGRTSNLPTSKELKKMSPKQLNYIYNSYLDNTDIICNRQIRLGTVADGGYETCDDYQYRPIKPCIAYSFGIRNEFSFDDDVGKLYGCDVYSFDPAMNKDTHRRSDRVMFYKIAIGGNAHKTSDSMIKANKQLGWEVKNLTEIKAMLNHRGKVIDILKLDIEASEWPTLQDITATGELKQVRQLLIEYHRYDTTLSMQAKIEVLQKVEAMGFRRFRTHMFWHKYKWHQGDLYPVERGCCYEMGFVNTHLARDPPLGRK